MDNTNDLFPGSGSNWFKRAADWARDKIGMQKEPMEVARTHSNNGIAVPTSYGPDKGAHLKTVNRLSQRELEASQERHGNANQTLTDEQARAMSWKGAVMDGSTGKTYSRFGSEEKMAAGYVKEAKERDMRQDRSM